jgi:hypothetical protein
MGTEILKMAIESDELDKIIDLMDCHSVDELPERYPGFVKCESPIAEMRRGTDHVA